MLCKIVKKNFFYNLTYTLLILGFGVFTTQKIEPNQFICEYAGEIISEQEGYIRQDKYRSKDGSFLFFFQNLW